jgi:hypothetical protein
MKHVVLKYLLPVTRGVMNPEFLQDIVSVRFHRDKLGPDLVEQGFESLREVDIVIFGPKDRKYSLRRSLNDVANEQLLDLRVWLRKRAYPTECVGRGRRHISNASGWRVYLKK